MMTGSIPLVSSADTELVSGWFGAHFCYHTTPCHFRTPFLFTSTWLPPSPHVHHVWYPPPPFIVIEPDGWLAIFHASEQANLFSPLLFEGKFFRFWGIFVRCVLMNDTYTRKEVGLFEIIILLAKYNVRVVSVWDLKLLESQVEIGSCTKMFPLHIAAIFVYFRIFRIFYLYKNNDHAMFLA